MKRKIHTKRAGILGWMNVNHWQASAFEAGAQKILFQPVLPICAVMLVLILLAACTPGVLEVRTAPETQVTGEAVALRELGPVAHAVLSGSVEARRNLIELLQTPCTQASGLGGPPPCQEGEQEGTRVTVFPIGGSEGSFARVEDINRSLLFDTHRLYAIYKTAPGPVKEAYWPQGEYGLIFEREINNNPLPITVMVSGGRIVRLDFHSEPPEALLERIPAAQVIIPPEHADAWLARLGPISTPAATAEPLLFSTDPIPAGWPSYTSPESGYTLRYPADWQVAEPDRDQFSQEVSFRAPGLADFHTTLTIARDERSLEQIQQLYRTEVPGAVLTRTIFAGQPALLFTYLSPRVEIYVQHAGMVFVILTDESGKHEVRQAISSFTFTE